MRRIILLVAIAGVLIWIFLFVKRSIPYSDNAELIYATISIDSIWTLGPAAGIYDKSSKQFYWLKSLNSFDPPMLDTFKSKQANIQYMKIFGGPLENRIYKMVVDSVIVFDQVLEEDSSQ